MQGAFLTRPANPATCPAKKYVKLRNFRPFSTKLPLLVKVIDQIITVNIASPPPKRHKATR
ncbi:hypothetical protein TMES_20185 [Thalassospira mesophila]|uniref:Uncharacterized protein n=1 Tax=Thalassospira mesophila TaxID=1293891 RepID=A0A1Y2KVC1_9PROT|nr:hypothetical protein TMES_20185 [Thalassospira mesophila]